MLNKNWLALIFCNFLLAACAVTGPADDGYDNSNEWVDTGRLLSEDVTTVYSSEPKQDAPTSEPIQASAMALDEKTEFEYFKKWNQLRTEGAESAEYQEFLQWLKFQNFKAAQ